MKKIALIATSIFTFNSLLAFTNTSANKTAIVSIQTPSPDSVTATINKDTTEQQFEELFTYFKENGISVDFNKIKYNTNNEIIGISIRLEKDGQQSHYSMNTNIPIQEIELGYKNDQLFVAPKGSHIGFGNNDISSLMEQFNQKGLSSFDLNSFFNNENMERQFGGLSHFFQNSFGDLDELIEQMRGNIKHSKSDSVSPNNSIVNHSIPKFNFIDRPDIDKVIIIDGKESDFKTLNTLAQNNKLDTVDNLKPATAMSLYGKKAKDGAIIATTIQK